MELIISFLKIKRWGIPVSIDTHKKKKNPQEQKERRLQDNVHIFSIDTYTTNVIYFGVKFGVYVGSFVSQLPCDKSDNKDAVRCSLCNQMGQVLTVVSWEM